MTFTSKHLNQIKINLNRARQQGDRHGVFYWSDIYFAAKRQIAAGDPESDKRFEQAADYVNELRVSGTTKTTKGQSK